MVFAFLIFLNFVLVFVAGECPSGSVEWHSQCFSFYSNSTGFADAELSCQGVGGHLASIHDGFANALLARKFYHVPMRTSNNFKFQKKLRNDFGIAPRLTSGSVWAI